MTINRNMMKTFTFLLASFIFFNAHAQNVGIGTETPHPMAVLDVYSSSNPMKGMLIPRVNSTQREAIIPSDDTPAVDDPAGLMVYDTDQKGFMFYENGTWQNVGVPRGTIVMWSGKIAPKGWIICDGLNNTPNLKGRFILGYDAGTPSYNEPGNISTQKFAQVPAIVPGNTGGVENVTLTAAQSGLRAHNHSLTDNGHNHASGQYQYLLRYTGDQTVNVVDSNGVEPNLTSMGAIQSSTTGITINNVADQNASQSHENRPPYYVLAYIMKL